MLRDGVIQECHHGFGEGEFLIQDELAAHGLCGWGMGGINETVHRVHNKKNKKILLL